MGFNVSHVWRTTDAGVSWIDFSGALPDAPANSVVVDPGGSLLNGTVYVGTDVGVFASSTGAPAWSEVMPSFGTQGFLPNTAVTSLAIFNSGNLKRLRAATYGRGIWEWNLVTAPAYQIYVPNNPITIFAGQTATFSGSIQAFNGYNSNVSLSCVSGLTSAPQICSATPTPLLPIPAGTPFTVTASGGGGDYAFNLHALGTDPNALTLDFSLTLHIVDFDLSPPTPNSVSVVPGNVSPPVSMVVSGLGSFAGAVSLSCSGLPASASCQFQPSNTVSPVSTNPISVAMSVNTSSSTPLGTSQIAITASSPGGTDKTQTLALTVGAAPDYSLVISKPNLTTHVNLPAVFNGTLASVNGYASPVNLSCDPAPPAPPSCVANPASVTPGISGAPFTVTVSSAVSQAYAFNITGVGSDPLAITHSAAVNLTVLPVQSFDFTLSATPSNASVSAGSSALYSLDVSPTPGTFPSAVTFSCSTPAALSTCTFNPAQVPSGSGDSVVTMTVTTTAALARSPKGAALSLVVAFPIAGILWLGQRRRTDKTAARKRRRLIATLLLVFGTLAGVSCSGGLHGSGGGGGTGSPGTLPGVYNITVTATSGGVTHSAQVSLTVTP